MGKGVARLVDRTIKNNAEDNGCKPVGESVPYNFLPLDGGG